MIKVYRRKYDYRRPDKYLLFLKEEFVKRTPRFYSILGCKRLETADGPMYSLHLVVGEIENPEYEPVAECWINDEFIYLWRDYCWTLAVDKYNKRVHKTIDKCEVDLEMVRHSLINITPPPCNKVVVIHRIGQDPVE